MAADTELSPGWLQRQMASISALGRAHAKIIAADKARRGNGYTRPTKIEFTASELRELASEIRATGILK